MRHIDGAGVAMDALLPGCSVGRRHGARAGSM